MKKFAYSAAIMALIGAFAMPAMADHHGKKNGERGKGGDRMFEQLDTNRDGVITRDEFIAHATKRFEAMDANKDGQVTKEEAKAHYETKRQDWKDKRGKKQGE